MIDDYGNNVFFMSKLPVRAASTRNEDGSHSIFINASLPEEVKVRCYLHELYHIRNSDFDREDVQEIEYEAHEVI